MKHCIHINTATKTVTVKPMPKDIHGHHALIGQPSLCLGACLKNGDFLYADDEAEYRKPLANQFVIEGYTLRGNAVVVRSSDATGADCTPKSKLDSINVKFL